MNTRSVNEAWESAAPGWARWEPTVMEWMAPATALMLEMAGVSPGARVVDVASGAGSQTLLAAERVGPHGHVLATDISETMLRYVRDAARGVGLSNVATRTSAAEELALQAQSFDAAICRLGLMLFAEPVRALKCLHAALRPGGKLGIVVFTTPVANPMMAKPMEVLLRHAGKTPPAPGQPGIFALGAPGVLERVCSAGGFEDFEQRIVSVPLRMATAKQALAMMQEGFGAYRAVLNNQPENVRAAAWAEAEEVLETFMTPAGFVAPGAVLVAGATRGASE